MLKSKSLAKELEFYKSGFKTTLNPEKNKADKDM